MPKFRLLGLALALSICGAAAPPRAAASKITVDAQAVRKDAAAQLLADEPAETAIVPRDLDARPAVQPKREPVKYDALPEKERKQRPGELLLDLMAEV